MANVLRGPEHACLVVLSLLLTMSYSRAEAQHHTLTSFEAPTGAAPSGIARARDGTLYGATREGGAHGKGAIVAVSRGVGQAIYSFRGTDDGAAPSSVVLGSDGALYGLSAVPAAGEVPSQTAVFRVTTSGSFSIVAKLGDAPEQLALVLGQDGVIYVSSASEYAVLALDAYGGGLRPAFKLDPGTWANAFVVTRRGELFAATRPSEGPSQIIKGASNGTISVLATLPVSPEGSNELAIAFARTSDGTLYVSSEGGASPALYSLKSGGQLQALGTLDGSVRYLAAATSGNDVFGATGYGVSAPQGSLVQVTRGKLSVVAVFKGGAEGAVPSSLITANNSVYGSASDGGGGGFGTLFRYSAGQGLSAAYSFSYPNGAAPTSLVRGSDGAFYGVTQEGGPAGAGTVFKVDDQGALETVHAFSPSEGVSPQNLIEGQDGALYGRTSRGGSADFGTLFKVDKNGTLTVLTSFTQEGQGRGPALVRMQDGTLYGADDAGSGHIFRFTTAGQLEEVHAFTGLMTREGASPSRLIAGPEGVFYGVTEGAYGPMIPPPYSSGTIFRLNADGTLDTLYAFNDDKNALGALPRGVLLGQDGMLYGTTSNLSFLCGVAGKLWKLDPRTADKPLITHAFTDGDDGTGPTSLMQTASGRFFGLTLGGRGHVGGDTASCVSRNSTLFEQSEAAGFRTLEQLNLVIGASSSGASPEQASSLVEGSDGRLYGTFSSGGSAGAGEIFVFEPPPPAAAAQ